MTHLFPILWLTGNSGAGKSTLAQNTQKFFRSTQATTSPYYQRVLILDGDEMRTSISTEEGFSQKDRHQHNLRVARLASILQKQNFLVLVSVIAPFISTRKDIDALCSPRWIYVKRTGLQTPDRPYEEPMHPDLIIDNDTSTEEQATNTLIHWLHAVQQE